LTERVSETAPRDEPERNGTSKELTTVMNAKKTTSVLWGVGNPLRGDDGFGVHVAEALLEAPPQGMKIRLCETTPENHLAHLRRTRPSRLVVVDAALMGLAPGAMRRLPLASCKGISWSSHGVPLSTLLEEFSREMDLVIIAVEPAFREHSLELSPEVAEAKTVLLALLEGGELESIPLLEKTSRNAIP
jgi:hydrogenase 3 maturation protease